MSDEKIKSDVVSKPKKKRKKKKKKFNFWTLLFILLMLGGLGVLLYPTMCDYYYKYNAQKEVEQYDREMKSETRDYSELWEAAEAYNRDLLARGGALTSTNEEKSKVENLLNPLGTGMMGYITIPSINVKLPIYQGTEEKELQSGAGYWLGSSLPTGGEGTHCIITAHTGLVKAKMFTDVDKLEVGDRFTLSILDRNLTYEVDNILVTEPDEMEALRIDPNADYVTLYTCTPYGINTHRLLVRGHRIEVEEPKKPVIDIIADEIEEKTGIDIRLIYLAAIILLLLIILIIILSVRKNKKIKKSKKSKNKKATKSE